MRRRKKLLSLLLPLFSALLLFYILTSLYTSPIVPETSGTPEGESDSSPENIDETETETQTKIENETLAEMPSGSPMEPRPTPMGPMFVVPENPLGTIGAFSVLSFVFGIFALKKRDK